MIVFHSDLLIRRRISFSPPSLPSTTFWEALLRPKTTDFEAHEGRSTRRWQPRRKQEAHTPSRAAFLRQLAVHVPAHECACGRVPSSLVTGLHTQGRPAPSWCSIPPAVQPEPSLSTFWAFFFFFFFASAVSFSSSSAPSVHPQSSSVHLQSYSIRFGSPFSSSSSSTAVIRPLIRALFNPNVVQSPVKWIWQLKILFLLLLSLDLLLSHQKN